MAVNLQPFPNTGAPAEEGGSVSLAQIWYYLLRTMWQRLGGSGATLPAVTAPPDGPPFLYESDISGTLVVSGGTVTEISIVRGTSNVITGVVAGPIPVLRGDTVAIVYSVEPTVTFLPSEFMQTAT